MMTIDSAIPEGERKLKLNLTKAVTREGV